NKQVIDAMWSGNENLRNWFSGNPVLFQQADNTTAPQTIALDELIANFKAALASRSIKVIVAMWSGNENLHTAVSSTQVGDQKALANLLNSFLSSKMQTNFIIGCLAYFPVGIRQASLVEKQRKTKRSAYLNTQITCLQVSLDNPSTLNIANAPVNHHHSHNNLRINSVNKSQPMLTKQPQRPQERKRHTLFQNTASATKKQRLEYIGEITSSQSFTTTQASIEQQSYAQHYSLSDAPQRTHLIEGSSNVLEETNSATDVATNQHFNNDNGATTLFDDDWSWLYNIDTAQTSSTFLTEKIHVGNEEQRNHISSFGDSNNTFDSSFAWDNGFFSGPSPKLVSHENQYSTYKLTDDDIRQTSLPPLTCNNELVSDAAVSKKTDSGLNTPTLAINSPLAFFGNAIPHSITNTPDLLLDLPQGSPKYGQ
ncbi:MAG: hypothetical protein KAG45_09215, partial [Methyloprofundus sp.]|nr:hypothetical protein [Methyloprofundus sp.]